MSTQTFIYIWYSSYRFYNTDLPFIYIGTHKGEIYDGYISSSPLFNIEQSMNPSIWKRIIFRSFKDDTDRTSINTIESSIIKNAMNRYGKARVINKYYNGFGNKHFNSSGMIRVKNIKTGRNKMIYPHTKDFMIENGWTDENLHSSTTGKICITDGSKNRFIDKSYNNNIPEGWRLGMLCKFPADHASIPNGNICVNKDGINKFINPSNILDFEMDGWTVGISPEAKDNIREKNKCRGKIRLKKDGLHKFFDIEEVDTMIYEGWSTPNGSIKNGSIGINNGVKNKYVEEEKLLTYLNDGWKIGCTKRIRGSITGRISIIKGELHKYVNEQDLEEYLNDGWLKGAPQSGLKNRTAIHNFVKTKYVKAEELEEYLKNGWHIGGMSRKNKQ